MRFLLNGHKAFKSKTLIKLILKHLDPVSFNSLLMNFVLKWKAIRIPELEAVLFRIDQIGPQVVQQT